MNDMRAVIIPKSDQINADNLLGGPMSIKITSVEIRPGTEQPVSIHFENDNGKPFKPCKSMARVMVACWGPDANTYVGRSMTLYCDPSVRWGGMEVGGIRISHMSDLDGTKVMALTATKGNKKPFTVKPLVVDKPATQRRTFTDFLAEMERDLAGANTIADVEAIAERETVRKVLDVGTDVQKGRTNDLIKAALDRVTPEPGDAEDAA